MVEGLIGTREVLCGGCGYDLRGAAVVEGRLRCPECGRVGVRGERRSRVPWVHRRVRGRVRAFVATVGMVLLRPGVMGEEVQRRVRRGDGRRFHEVALVVGMVIGTGWLAGVVAMVSPRLPEAFWPGIFSAENNSEGGTGPGIVAFALTDSWWVLLPIVLTVYLSLRVTMWVNRGLFAWGKGGELGRRRAGRLAWYGSALVPVEMMLLGMAAVGGMALEREGTLPALAETWVTIAVGLLIVTAALLYYVVTFLLLRRLTGVGILRAVGVVLSPVVIVTVWYWVIVGVSLATGYAAVALWSMSR